MNIQDVIDGLELLARDVPRESAILCLQAAQLLDAARRLRLGVDMHEGFAIVTQPMELKIGIQCWDALAHHVGDQKTPDGERIANKWREME